MLTHGLFPLWCLFLKIRSHDSLHRWTQRKIVIGFLDGTLTTPCPRRWVKIITVRLEIYQRFHERFSTTYWLSFYLRRSQSPFTSLLHGKDIGKEYTKGSHTIEVIILRLLHDERKVKRTYKENVTQVSTPDLLYSTQVGRKEMENSPLYYILYIQESDF